MWRAFFLRACSEGTGEETGGEIWDPLDISGSVGDEALMWFRASELKHGRVAMLATVGYLTGAAGITFPGEIAGGVSFASVNANGVFSAWSNVPEAGKLQVTLHPPPATASCVVRRRAPAALGCTNLFSGGMHWATAEWGCRRQRRAWTRCWCDAPCSCDGCGNF